MRTVLIHNRPMRTADLPREEALDAGAVSLAVLPVGARGSVVGVGAIGTPLSPLERRLLEFGFVNGEHVEILTEAPPGRRPFVRGGGHTPPPPPAREDRTA